MPKTYETEKTFDFESEERYRKPSHSLSEHYATLGRHNIHKPTSYSQIHQPRTSSMDRKKVYSTREVFKSESRLDSETIWKPTTSYNSGSRTWLPGEPITTYEERYESSSEVETWIQTQTIGTRMLDKHDRMVAKIKGWFEF
uniref:Uncharacterized protein n=1 Tax=Panagrolaimus sp. JU765 TaxID=591449 RepID=A0AC34R718_9BILA